MNALRLFLAAALLLSGCVGQRPAALPVEPAYLVAVKSVRIPTSEPWISRFAYHTWLDLKKGSENAWERMEILSAESGVNVYSIFPAEARSNDRWTNPVEVVGLVTGENARQMIPRLEANARNFPWRSDFSGWPGPEQQCALLFLGALPPASISNSTTMPWARIMPLGFTPGQAPPVPAGKLTRCFLGCKSASRMVFKFILFNLRSASRCSHQHWICRFYPDLDGIPRDFNCLTIQPRRIQFLLGMGFADILTTSVSWDDDS